ncbi:Trafficking protein particle complex subunit 2-like protein [Escovopsis weberi]|uniref:Trafficking protein particle complex subunit 2-like protein n=1 Tax=Escovopsis weberi TaxID=150374 RepID=A0A0M9VUS5_ESCWE|nr:Trafficking protein particle complex subunit 2-like protein [Escovopsis weberi]
MATLIPSIVCLGVIGRNNNPLHMSTFASHSPSTNAPALVRNHLQFSLLLSSTIDIFELRSRQNTASGDFGLLHAIDDRLAAYGHETNTGVRLVAIVDMRGRVPDGPPTPGSATATAGAATASAGAGGAAAAALAGLRDAEMRPVFRAMGSAYVRLLQNPFYDPDEHAPLGGRGGKRITNRSRYMDVKTI